MIDIPASSRRHADKFGVPTLDDPFGSRAGATSMTPPRRHRRRRVTPSASLKTRPRRLSQSASWALTCSACCREQQQATTSSAYADSRVMPRGVLAAWWSSEGQHGVGGSVNAGLGITLVPT